MMIQDSWRGFEVSMGILQVKADYEDTLYQALLDFYNYHGIIR